MSLVKRDAEVLWHPFAHLERHKNFPAIIRGANALLFDEEGRRYIDAVSSWWVNLHGHAHPHISARLKEQLDLFHHVTFADFTHAPAIELAQKLLQILPGSPARIFFSDDGSTAVEVALKLAIQFWQNRGQKRLTFVALEHAYHGDTFGAMSVSSRGTFNAPFSESLFKVLFIPTPGNKEAPQILKRILETELVAGFIFEPLIQAAGGMRMHQAVELDGLLALCKEHGVLLISDEVMSGFGRTGELFASDALKNAPDLICLSKGLSGGSMALGATSVSSQVYQSFIEPSSQMLLHGHSFTANALACVAALASLDILLDAECARNRERINQSHRSFAAKFSHELLYNIRTCGTVLAFEVGAAEYDYASVLRDRIYQHFFSKGILLRPLGNTVYFMPPYCITDVELDEVYAAIRELFKQDWLSET